MSKRPQAPESAPVRIQVTDSTLVPDRTDATLFSSWRIALVGAILALILLPLVHIPEFQVWLRTNFRSLFGIQDADAVLTSIANGTYQNHYWLTLNYISDGLIVTFQVTGLSIIFATLIGLLVGMGQISRLKVLNKIATVYVEIIRGIPLVVQIFYIYYSLGQFLQIGGIPAAVAAMSICYGAYMGEIFRAGLQAVPRGQMEAALALGMTRRQAISQIVLPQTVKIVLPAVGNEFIALLKDSSLVSMLSLVDLMQRGRQYTSRTFMYFESFTMVALLYLVITLFLSRIVGIIEEALHSRGRSYTGKIAVDWVGRQLGVLSKLFRRAP